MNENPNTASPSESEEQRLSLEEAQQEANMLRAKAGVDPENGEVYKGDRKGVMGWYKEFGSPTSEDYDKALIAVEEMKRLAEEEPSMDKFKAKLELIVEQTKWGAILLATLGFRAPTTGSWEYMATQDHEEAIRNLSDASLRLKQLQEEAKKI